MTCKALQKQLKGSNFWKNYCIAVYLLECLNGRHLHDLKPVLIFVMRVLSALSMLKLICLSRILHIIFEQKSDYLLLCKWSLNFSKTLIITAHRLYFGSNSFPFILVTHHMFSKFIFQWRRDIADAVHNHLWADQILRGGRVLGFIFLSIFVVVWLKRFLYVYRISLSQSLLEVNEIHPHKFQNCFDEMFTIVNSLSIFFTVSILLWKFTLDGC